jgi:hypothetical protein
VVSGQVGEGSWQIRCQQVVNALAHGQVLAMFSQRRRA